MELITFVGEDAEATGGGTDGKAGDLVDDGVMNCDKMQGRPGQAEEGSMAEAVAAMCVRDTGRLEMGHLLPVNRPWGVVFL